MCIHVKSWEKGKLTAITDKEWQRIHSSYGSDFEDKCLRCGECFGSGGYTVGMQFFASHFCSEHCARDFSSRLEEMTVAASRESKMTVD